MLIRMETNGVTQQRRMPLGKSNPMELHVRILQRTMKDVCATKIAAQNVDTGGNKWCDAAASHAAREIRSNLQSHQKI